MFVRKRSLDERNIDGNHVSHDKPWNLREKNRRIITLSFINRFPGIIAYEKCILAEVSFELDIRIRCYAKTPNMKNLRVEKGFRI